MPDGSKVTISIRRATPHDAVNIMRLLEQAVQENEVAYPPIDSMKLAQWVLNCKRDGEILVADCSGRIVGVLGLMTQEWKWSREKYIGNEFFYVAKNYRDKGTADALITAAKSFCEKYKIRLVFGFSGGKDAYIKDRMMQMKGAVYAGGNFVWFPQSLLAGGSDMTQGEAPAPIATDE